MNLENVSKLTLRADKTGRGGGGKPSVALVYTAQSGKRMSLSASLIEELEVKDSVYMGAVAEERQMIISGQPNPNLEKFSLRSGRYVYNSSLVSGIVNTFELVDYFSNHSSISFSEIDFEDGVAIVNIPSLDSEAGEEIV